MGFASKSLRVSAMVLLALCFALGTVAGDGDSFEKEFAAKYSAWRERIRKPDLRESSGPGLMTCEEAQALIGMGPKAVPLMMQKLDEREDPYGAILWVAVRDITKKQFSKDELFKLNPRDLWGKWWQDAHETTPKQFVDLWREWRTLEQQQASLLKQARDLGILVIPSIIERLKQGETELIPLLSELTDGEVKPEWLPDQCLEWWDRSKDAWNVPHPSDDNGK